MKTNTPKQRKQGAAVRVKDLEPKKNPKAGELKRASEELKIAQAKQESMLQDLG